LTAKSCFTSSKEAGYRQPPSFSTMTTFADWGAGKSKTDTRDQLKKNQGIKPKGF